MPLRAVLFDFDGTLVDTTELIYQSMRHAAGEVLGRGFSRETLLANVGQPLPYQMELLAGGDPDLAATLVEIYSTHNATHHDRYVGEFPGVSDALERLRGAGLRLAVVTSKRHRSVEMALASFPALRRAVDCFVTMESTADHKPHPAPLFKGLELLGGISTDEAAYVGDSPFDVQAAKAAGLTSIAVSWGAFTAETLRDADPDHLVEDLGDAVDLLLEIC